ncbi:bystin [Histoplasma capsulatum var. duboisii H88]|uniref:Bystin n=1 Tax=Ajellomyces capsulatus (strain H88) TaxID=544711 RepID=F0UHV7_AJEC8|nr:bystin [Histoplasma capsulatum var. duboisii H88]QSS56124.1 bystin [Histoplasma capsulatum var. duboisii H88]
MPKLTAAERKHAPLADDILSAGHLRTKSAKRKSRSYEDDGDHYLDSKTSKKILQIGQDLADEDAEESRVALTAAGITRNTAFDFESRFAADADAGDGDEDAGQNGEEWGDDEEEIEEVEVDPGDLDTFHKFVPRGEEDPIFNPRNPDDEGQGHSTNLADLILEKIATYEAGNGGGGQPQVGGGSMEDAVELPAKAVEVYQRVGFLLSRYKSGPLPKPFKILPTLPQWQTLLEITQPEKWTPNTIYAATRIFISAKPHIAQEFLNTVLLDRVRDDIHETKKLHVHIYNALKKALYKPACFFKGFLFPLVQSGTCTLREAHIVSSVIARVSIPVLHSAAALLRLCDLAAEKTASTLSSEGTGALNMFIRVFLEKKYALPYKVVDALVFHFLRFRASEQLPPSQGAGSGDTDMADAAQAAAANSYKLPVLWHKSLLVFAQRYRNDITEDQREALLDLLLVRGHKDIGPEVRRELLAGRGRGIVLAGNAEGGGGGVGVSNGGDDTMDMGI